MCHYYTLIFCFRVNFSWIFCFRVISRNSKCLLTYRTYFIAIVQEFTFEMDSTDILCDENSSGNFKKKLLYLFLDIMYPFLTKIFHR